MTEDARFEDGREAPLNLGAMDVEDLKVLSSLVQDAVARVGDVAWMPKRRRVALVLNRFRWEDREAADKQKRAYERVRTALVFEDVIAMKARGIDEDEAYALLRKTAMDQGRRVAEVAEALVTTAGLLS